MALFNIRLPRFKASTEAIAPAPTESIEAMRRRARHRLIGATVLVLGVVLVFPLVFDTQPRPIPVDVPIAIPDRAKAKPLILPASAPELAVSAAAAPVEPVPVEVQLPASSAQPALKPVRPPVAALATPLVAPPPVIVKPEVKPRPEPKVETKARPADTKPDPDPRAAADAGQRARDLLNGRKDSTSAATDAGRFVVQAGSYTDAAKAHEARIKIEKAGLVTYTQVIESKNGDKRIRVRIGPFASKAEADKAASRLRSLDLSAAILSL